MKSTGVERGVARHVGRKKVLSAKRKISDITPCAQNLVPHVSYINGQSNFLLLSGSILQIKECYFQLFSVHSKGWAPFVSCFPSVSLFHPFRTPQLRYASNTCSVQRCWASSFVCVRPSSFNLAALLPLHLVDIPSSPPQPSKSQHQDRDEHNSIVTPLKIAMLCPRSFAL